MNVLTISFIVFFVVLTMITGDNMYSIRRVHLAPQEHYTHKPQMSVSANIRVFLTEGSDIAIRVYRNGTFDKEYNVRSLVNEGIEGLRFTPGVNSIEVVNVGDSTQNVWFETSSDGSWTNRIVLLCFLLSIVLVFVTAMRASP